MSYASGFMVGTSIGKAVYDMFHNKKGKAAAAAVPAGVCRSQVQRQSLPLLCPILPAFLS
ncbi:MAG: hypothetical protein PUD48_05330 [Megasphaera elsdenii]|nr:hypothetical protein [Megasphaera elsdenii]